MKTTPLLYRGSTFESLRALKTLVEKDPDPSCGFRVRATYGPEAHGGLHYERFGAFEGSDIPPMAPEQALIVLLQCIGTDYLEFADGLGVPIEEVTLSIEGEFDLRPSFVPLGLRVPASARAGYKELRVRVDARTSASKDDVAKAHGVLWETNILGDSLRAVPMRVTVHTRPSRGGG